MVDAVLTTTLADLIEDVAARLGDLQIVEATHIGTTTTFKDTLNIRTGNEDLSQRQMLFRTGNIANQAVMITGTDTINHEVTFDPPKPVVPEIGDIAIIVNKRMMGWTLLEYKRAIQRAVRDSYRIARVPIISTAASFAKEDPYVTIPSTMDIVSAVEYQDSNGNWWPVPVAEGPSMTGWQANYYEATVGINGKARLDSDTRMVRLIGSGRHSPLNLYSDTTTLHPLWLTSQACYHLCMGGLDRDPSGTRSRTVLEFQREAEGRMTLIRSRQEPTSRKAR